jgi:hypothetical protein
VGFNALKVLEIGKQIRKTLVEDLTTEDEEDDMPVLHLLKRP